MSSVWDDLARQLAERHSQHLLRHRYTVAGPQAAHLVVDGQRMLAFCSNDYLGLANHPYVIEQFTLAAQRYGVGGGASHLVCGHTQEHQLLEQEFAARTGRERALLFSTGYMANLGVLTALLDRRDAVFEDKLNHASLLDGGRLSGARWERFLHNDLTQLEKRLRRSQARRKLICVDGVFSMDGDVAPLEDLSRLAAQYDAVLMVDDAHGFGVLGQQGNGLCELQGLGPAEVPILMCTLGKALGTFGAIVAGSHTLIETLVQFARSYIYTTSLPPAVAAATRASFTLLDEEAWRRAHLQKLIALFRTEVAGLDLTLLESTTAIQPLVVGDAERAWQWQRALRERGIWITAIRPPTVPPGTARLRITLSAAHTEDHVCQLVEALGQVADALPRQEA